MVARRLLAAVAAAVALFTPLACQDVIGLGEEPRVEEAHTRCGLPPSLNLECRDCMTANCCEAQLACDRDPRCREAARDCLAWCWNPACATDCLERHADNSLFTELWYCGAASCDVECLTKGDCFALASDCCQNLDGPVEESCLGVALTGDQAECRSVRPTLSSACSSE